MARRRLLLHFGLVFLFLFLQGLVLVHGLEHGIEPEHQDSACHLCLAGHGLGHAVAGAAFALILPPAAPVRVGRPVRQPGWLALPCARQRGPPVFA